MPAAARRFPQIIVAALAVGALTTGCDSVQPRAPFTQQQAVDRASARAQEAFAKLPAGARLKVDRNEPAMPCDNGPGDKRTFVDTVYLIEYSSGWPVEQTVPILADYWQRNGYQTVRDDRQDNKAPELFVEDRDGFDIGIRLMYRDNGRIDAYLISSSPCL